MNYKDSKNKEQLRKFKNASITKLDAIITTGIDSEDTNKYKKSALITYWINDFSNYLNWESSFDPKRLKRYERGDVIKVNFGFNIGSEQGGMHYAIVIDAKNAINNGTITIKKRGAAAPSPDSRLRKFLQSDHHYYNILYTYLSNKREGVAPSPYSLRNIDSGI